MSERTLVRNAAFALTLNDAREIIRDASILIEGGRIAFIGRGDSLGDASAETVIDGRNSLVMPGFCNAHVHVSYAHAVRGVFSDNLPRAEYVQQVFQLQGLMTEEEEFLTSLLAITELLLNGTTTFLDPGSARSLDALVAAIEVSGARAVVGRHVADRPNKIGIPFLSIDQTLREVDKMVSNLDGALAGRVSAWVMPFSTRVASRELLKGLKAIADDHHTGLTLHQNFEQAEAEEFRELHGLRPIEALAEWGVLDRNVLLAHGTDLVEADIPLLSRHQPSLVICPAAALKLATGITRASIVPGALDAGLRVALGTDSVNNGGPPDILRSIYLAALLFKDVRGDTRVVPAEQAVEMATINGAAALGLASRIGSLEVGKAADLVLFDLERPEWNTLFDPVNSLVYAADGRSVHAVLVNGRLVVANSAPVFVDLAELTGRVQQVGTSLLARAGRKVVTRWPLN